MRNEIQQLELDDARAVRRAIVGQCVQRGGAVRIQRQWRIVGAEDRAIGRVPKAGHARTIVLGREAEHSARRQDRGTQRDGWRLGIGRRRAVDGRGWRNQRFERAVVVGIDAHPGRRGVGREFQHGLGAGCQRDVIECNQTGRATTIAVAHVDRGWLRVSPRMPR